MGGNPIDCRFFLQGACRNGDACAFRHSEGAQGTEEVCDEFAQTGHCSAGDCGRRHPAEEVPRRAALPPNEVPCRNEENGGECTRPGCIFKHARAQPKPAAGLNAAAKAFVPRAAPRPPVFGNMEWTPGVKAAPAAPQPGASATSGPPAAPQASAFAASMPPVAPQISAFAASGPPAAPQTSAFAASGLPAAPQTGAFGAFRPPTATQPSAFGSTKPPAAPQTSAFGSTKPPAAPQTSAFGSTKPPGAPQTTSSAFAAGGSTGWPAKQPHHHHHRQRAGVGSIQTIYGILGLPEREPGASVARFSRENYRPKRQWRRPAAAAGPPETGPDDAKPEGVAKRASAGQEPTVKRARGGMTTTTTPTTTTTTTTTTGPKNYMALFEQQLGDLSSGLSGPLEGAGPGDRISQATLDEDG